MRGCARLRNFNGLFKRIHFHLAKTLIFSYNEYRNIIKNPIPDILTHPLEDNILEWHYAIYASKGDYKGGCYRMSNMNNVKQARTMLLILLHCVHCERSLCK